MALNDILRHRAIERQEDMLKALVTLFTDDQIYIIANLFGASIDQASRLLAQAPPEAHRPGVLAQKMMRVSPGHRAFGIAGLVGAERLLSNIELDAEKIEKVLERFDIGQEEKRIAKELIDRADGSDLEDVVAAVIPFVGRAITAMDQYLDDVEIGTAVKLLTE